MNAQSTSIVEIGEYSLKPKLVKAEETKQAEDVEAKEDKPEEAVDDKVPTGPTDEETCQETGYASSLPDAESPSESSPSNSGSVIIRTGAADRTPGDRLSSGLWVDLTSYESSSASVIPHKRSVHSASLPSSVSDSERTYGGHKHRSKPVDSRASSSSLSGISKRQSLIPRPVSTPGHVRSKSIITPLSPKSGLVVESDFERVEEDGALTVGNTDKGQSSSQASPVTPKSNLSQSADDGAEALSQERLSKLSTSVSRGSPCDISALSSETGSPSSPIEVTIVQRSETILLPGPANLPQLDFANGLFSIHCPFDLKPAAYEVSITLLVRLQKGCPRGWWELVLKGLPQLTSMDNGYVYFHFRPPSDQGIEVRTTHFKRHTLVENCLMAQFLIPKVVIPFRLCGQFYGVLKDFKVTQAIYSTVYPDDDPDFRNFRYYAVCSIGLLQRDIWAKECGFSIYVHGGPEGQFSCRIDSSQKLPIIGLGTGLPVRPSVSEVQINASPSKLGLFVVTWRVKLPRGITDRWLPHIKATSDHSSEDALQERFQTDIFKAESYEIVYPTATDTNGTEQEQQSLSPNKIACPHKTVSPQTTAWWKLVLPLCWHLFSICVTLRSLYRVPELSECCESGKKLLQLHDPVHNGEDDHVVTMYEAPTQVSVSFASESETESVVEAADPTSLPLRDRIDYLLGWKRPVADV